MRWIKLFENFEDIDSICEKYSIENYIINEDGTIDVNGDVNISDKGLTELPLRFRNVSGGFYCYNNQLTSLEGFPKSVGANFDCSDNQLTSLEGCPQSIGGAFYCTKNKLTSLEGCPQSVGGAFYCYNNQLTSLEGAPQSVGANFYCRDNQLVILQGIESIGGNLYCSNNPIEEIWDLFKDKDKIELFNYMDPTYLDEDGVACCSLTILNAFLEEIGKPPVTTLKNYKCVE